MDDKEILIDVTRLVWRLWRGGLPTGIDRVCLAYVEHFRDRAQAVIQRGGRYFVLGHSDSDRLFDSFLRGPRGFRRRLIQLALRSLPRARSNSSRPGALYLNIGHTGLNERTLSGWIERNHLRAVFFIHDLIPLQHPEYCRPGEAAKHLQRMQNVLRSAAGLIGNSQATVDDMASFAAAQGMPMPPAVAAWIAGPPVPPDVTPKRFGRPHFVVVGTIEARKNHDMLLRVWQRIVATLGVQAPLLVVVGQRGWEVQEAIALLDDAGDLRGHVVELNRCSDDELAGLISGARALLMPSFAEGFGLPVAEALALGTAVIASDLGVFREFAGDIPCYLDPLDDSAWERTILDFAGDSVERRRQMSAAATFKAPDWATHFDIVERWIRTLS